MDVAQISTQMHLRQVQEAAGTAVMKKTLDATSQNATNLLKMLDAIQVPGLGENIDLCC